MTRRCEECNARANVQVHKPVKKLVCYACYNRIRKEASSIKAEAIYKSYG